MKLIFCLFGIALCLSGHSQSVNHDSAVDCAIHWRLGETKTYSIIHEKSGTGVAGRESPFRFQYLAHVSVIDSSDRMFTIKWVFSLPEDFKRTNPGVADLLPVYNGMPMIFKVSDAGAFVTLVNWEEVRDGFTKQEELSLPKRQDSTSLAILEAAKRMFNSEKAVESMMINEIQLFHLLYGNRFVTSEISMESQLPNIFGGEPLSAHETYKLMSIDQANDTYTIVVLKKMNKGNMMKVLDPLLKKMNIKADSAIANARQQLESFDMQDRTEYQFAQSTGWVKRIFYVRSISGAVVNQWESYTIELRQ